jgi:hypothetical protein
VATFNGYALGEHAGPHHELRRHLRPTTCCSATPGGHRLRRPAPRASAVPTTTRAGSDDPADVGTTKLFDAL